jgi:hypothetical protein
MSGSTEDSEEQNFWPGYVDAISNLVLSLLFVTMILAMALLTSAQQTKVSDQKVDEESVEKKLSQLQGESQELEKIKLKLQTEVQELKAKSEAETKTQSQAKIQADAQTKVNGRSKYEATVENEGDPLKRKEIDMNAPGVQFLELVFSKDTLNLAFPDDVNFRNTVRGLGGDPSKWYYRLETLAETGDRNSRRQGFARLASVRAQLVKVGVPLHLIDLHVTEVADPQQANPQKIQISRIPYKWGAEDSQLSNGALPLEDLNKAQAEVSLSPVEVKFGAGSTSVGDAEQAAFRTDSRRLGADLSKGRYQLRARVQPGSSSARRLGFFRISTVREMLVKQGVPFDSIDINIAESPDINAEDASKITVIRMDQPSAKSAGDAVKASGSGVPSAESRSSVPQRRAADAVPQAATPVLATMVWAFKPDSAQFGDADKDAFAKAAASLGADIPKGRYQIRAQVLPDSAAARRTAFFRVSSLREQLVKLGVPFDSVDLNIADTPGISPEDAAKPTIARLR